MSRIALTLIFPLLLLLSACGVIQPDVPPAAPHKQTISTPAPAKKLTARVARIVDGDTLLTEIRGKQERVRMIGIDTPETKKEGTPVQYYGPEASAYTKANLTGKTVFLEFDAGERDKFGRLLAYVWRDAQETDPRKMFNSELLLKGYARLLTIPPNVKYAGNFKKYQAQAREKRAGLWK